MNILDKVKQVLRIKSTPLTNNVQQSDMSWGHETETFTPEKYGNYIATSVSVYACAQIRAKNLSQLPIKAYKEVKGERQPVTQGALVELLHKVNPHWTFMRLIEMTELSLCLWGSCYWFLNRGDTGKGKPTEIWWARPDRVKVIPDAINYIKGFIYEVNGERLTFEPSETIWFRYPNPIDEYSGLSPISAARLSIDLGIAGLRSNYNLFENGLQLGGVISPKDNTVDWTDKQVIALEDFFDKRFKGVSKAHRWAVINSSVNLSPVNLSPRDAEFIEQMNWSLGDVCRVYGVPPELVGDHRNATYSNITQAYKGLWTDTLIPEGTGITNELTEQLLPMFPNEADIIIYDLSGVSAIQEDRTQVVDQMSKLWNMGVPLNQLLQSFMPNLIREGTQGYPWGDTWYSPMTLVPIDQPRSAPVTPPKMLSGSKSLIIDRINSVIKELETPKELIYTPVQETAWKSFADRTEPQEKVFAKAVSKLFLRQQESVLSRLNAGKSKGIDDEPFDFASWAKRFKVGMQPFITDIYVEGGQAALSDLAVNINFDLDNPIARTWLEKRAQRFAVEVTQTTWDDLKGTLSEGMKAGESVSDLADRVKYQFNIASTSRAELIARTEVIGASNAGSLEAARQSDVVEKKVWLSALDARTRDDHIIAHDQKRKLDEDFEVGGFRGPGPGDMGDASQDCNCRCTVTYEVKE